MSRKRITQVFPFLTPLRVAQRKAFFYTGMRFDGCSYAKTMGKERLPHRLFEATCALYNRKTGFDMVYQENKVFKEIFV
jgi:vancomycin resistance protein VanW